MPHLPLSPLTTVPYGFYGTLVIPIRKSFKKKSWKIELEKSRKIKIQKLIFFFVDFSFPRLHMSCSLPFKSGGYALHFHEFDFISYDGLDFFLDYFI